MTRSVALRVVGSLAFRVACYSVMVWCALYAESWPSPSAALPDVLLDRVPYVAWVDQNNYLVWLVAYVPIALWLLARDADRFIRYMVTSGVVALARGACIMVTGLPAISGAHGALSFEQRWSAWLHLTTPLGFFDRDSGARVALTRDLFFSGHTATTFLLLLYVWRFPRLRWPMLVAHAVVMACVAFAHLHYAIDVIGAYAVTFSVYALREWAPARATPRPDGVGENATRLLPAGASSNPSAPDNRLPAARSRSARRGRP